MTDQKTDGNRPRRPQDEWQREFATSLRKATEQLAVGVAHEATAWANELAHDLHDRRESRRAERQRLRFEAQREKQRLKLEKKRAKHEAQYSSTSPAEGWVFAVAAIAMVAMAIINHSVWWLVFVALGLGTRGASIIGYHQRRRLTEPQPAPSRHGDSRDDRIDEICNRLKAALKDAPASVRDFLSKPDETVEALRKTSHDLVKRELSLRALANPSETDRLTRERVALQARIEMETDDVVRQRLAGALTALDHQRAQHAEVLKSANRLEAERTRLGYTLEGLYAQVMRLKTADAGSPDLDAGLRTSLDQLRDEMNALAEAVEQVNRTPARPALEPPETFDGATAKPGERVRS